MKYLAENAFQTPTFLIDQSILRRIESVGEINPIERAQASVPSGLNDARMSRLVEYQAMAPDQDAAYSLGDMLGICDAGCGPRLAPGRQRSMRIGARCSGRT
jgi:hypothetical protein